MAGYSLSKDVSDDEVKLLPELERKIKFDHASNLMKKAFSVPASIPQVWLNYIPPWEIEPGSFLEKYLQENPNRVDFLIISRGKLIIVEIDGPTHFGIFDENLHKWVIDERRYTRNLCIERSLRKQGYHLHHFSSWEIMRCTSDFSQYVSTKKAAEETFLFSSLIGELDLDISNIEINDEFIRSYPGLNPADL